MASATRSRCSAPCRLNVSGNCTGIRRVCPCVAFRGVWNGAAEAIAHGLPVVSTRAGAIPETVPPGTGLLVPPDDAAALAEALRRLVTRPTERQQLADEHSGSSGRAPHLAKTQLDGLPPQLKRQISGFGESG